MPSPPPPPPFGQGLYAILDLGALGDRDPEVVARALLAGGAVALQLRAKDAAPPDLLSLARALAGLTRAFGVPFYVNDDVALARLARADGVHLGQGDLAPEVARPLLAPGQCIGLSTHTLQQARAALARPVEYLGFGPVFPTRTKQDADPVQGLAALAEVCAQVPLPVVAIGGLTVARAASVARAGARAGAAIGAILGSADVHREAQRFHEQFCGVDVDAAGR